MFNNYPVKNERLLLAAVLGLLGLLILLGGLQYSWLGEISRSERENLQNRLNADSRRFAADFNNEIRWAYFTFQIDPGDWLKKDWTSFNQRYELWKTRAVYQNLVKEFYFVGKDSEPLKYNRETRAFEPTGWAEELVQIKNKIQENKDGNGVGAIIVNKYILLTPIYASGRQASVGENGVPHIKMDFAGYAAIKLDAEAVGQMLADLTQKYFPEDRFANYNLSISDNADQTLIFANKTSAEIAPFESDVKIALFDLASNQFKMVINSKIFSQSNSSVAAPRTPPNLPPSKISKKDSAKIQVFDTKRAGGDAPLTGEWTLNINHRDGSLEQFINNTRRKNLLVSFGILTLLGASVVLIFIATRRTQTLARRQLDFVSAVSHEFRTPLAVVHSAGENLSDGIVVSPEKIERYGGVIKTEAKKLSAMVEQILEFAGARGGQRKYVFRETQIADIIEDALSESQSLLNERGFTVETEIQENLPLVRADKNAMSSAIQNLIANSIKYGGDAKWLKVSATNGGGQVKISIADRGIGVAAADAAKIFSPFYRAKEVVDAQIHGSGLGLSLVKQTVEAHRGTIKLTSEQGKGSEFVIFLRLNES